MPELTVNLTPDMWNAMRVEGDQHGDDPAEIILNALSEYFDNSRDRLYQVSTSNALVEGVAEGAVDIATLRKYGDLGLGTFEQLDGEMVVVDGRVFQVRGNGSVSEVADDVMTPFATVARFRPDVEIVLKRCSHLGDLTDVVDGYFDYVRTRALCRMAPGTKLVNAAAVQPEFEYRGVFGTLVGFWSPEYTRTLSIPGYHLHFLSDDHTGGGHLLECRGADLTLGLQRGSRFNLVLPEASSFMDADLRRDPSEDLEKAETFQPERVK
jgi:acetolactate decarboxylase